MSFPKVILELPAVAETLHVFVQGRLEVQQGEGRLDFRQEVMGVPVFVKRGFLGGLAGHALVREGTSDLVLGGGFVEAEALGFGAGESGALGGGCNCLDVHLYIFKQVC